MDKGDGLAFVLAFFFALVVGAFILKLVGLI